MYSENGFNGGGKVAEIHQILVRNIKLHDVWDEVSGSSAELYAVDKIRYVGLNDDGNIAGLADVTLVLLGDRSSNKGESASLISQSCFVLSPDMQEVKCFGMLPGFSPVRGGIHLL